MNQPARKPFFLWRLIRGFWDALNFGRRLVLNLLFVLLLVIFLAALFQSAPVLQPQTALVLAPNGVLVEQYSAAPFERAVGKLTGDGVPEVQLRDLLRAIDAAAKDSRIDRIVLRPDTLMGAGFASLREVGEALRRFRESGKEVIAYADFMEQRQYYLAAQADEIYLHPEGMFWLEGLARYRTYYREAIEDKLKAKVHLFRAGSFKAFGEPFVRDSASPEALEADRVWMGDIWQRYLTEIAEARGLDAAALQAAIDSSADQLEAAGGDFAALAETRGLVDERITPDQLEARLIQRGVEDEDSFRQVDFGDYLALIDREKLPIDVRPQVAVVIAEGEIVDGEQPPGTIGGESTAALLRAAHDDEEIRAVVLRINSPGGSAFASEIIRRELDLLREAGKPVVASMGDVAASGGYWITLGADQVLADPSTITGSIGVFGMIPTFPETLESIGVRVDGIGTTAIAGALDPRRPLDPQVGRMIQASVDKIYRDFIARTAEFREMPPESVDEVAQGRVWSGAQALEHGLVDRMGGLGDALAEAAERAGLAEPDYQVRYIEPELDPWQQFFADMNRENAMLRGAAQLGLLPVLAEPRTASELRPWLRWIIEPGRPPLRAAAHCLCGL
ncbi:signal peptide peptidase SppA [Pseudomarimonas salicorniae]|uniref:Signal peptide peptidase SppA n=1 Tax=Pseudomarimonas salicorniae TaxID=2933270 RepID=A0ABT0GE97_9GAMM|nr:signal peptide peptidase SppA [Lysobacter sp. CAU 1642]MCK7592484.1 signal peptide peptidase SppA [Lysobacter sp. CAU 1642]